MGIDKNDLIIKVLTYIHPVKRAVLIFRVLSKDTKTYLIDKFEDISSSYGSQLKFVRSLNSASKATIVKFLTITKALNIQYKVTINSKTSLITKVKYYSVVKDNITEVTITGLMPTTLDLTLLCKSFPNLSSLAFFQVSLDSLKTYQAIIREKAELISQFNKENTPVK